MTSLHFKDLREFGTAAFMAIGPSRIAIPTLCLIEDSALDAVNKDKLTEVAIGRLDSARTWLSTLFPEGIEALDLPEPDILKDSRAVALDALAPLVRALETAGEDRQTLLRTAQKYKAHCLARVEPDVTQFLNHMTKCLTQEQSDRDKKRKNAILDTLRSAEVVGRTIRMISINASIEAASAGEHGRSFEAIASEMRALGGQTQEFLREISQLMLRDGQT